MVVGVGEIAQWLRIRTALAERRISIPSTPHGSPQPSITPVSGNLTPSFDIHEYQVCTCCT